MPNHQLSSRLNGVSESATLKLNAAVQAMKAKGLDVINLTAGEPDFAVPQVAKDAVVEALRLNYSKYTPVGGIPELRSLVAEKTNRQQPQVASSRPWTAANVLVTNGGKQAIFNALLALVNAGDEVLFGAPYWLSYPEMTKITGGKPVVIETTLQDRFKVQPKDLEAQLRNCVHPRVFIINSPSNPTGAMYTRSELIELGRVIDQFPDLCVISDEIYDRVLMGEIPFCSFLDACPGLRDRVITVNGMSKSAAMTGWRIGWSVAEPWITQGMSTIQGQSTSGINSLGQWASVAALKLPESAFAEWTESYQKRWRLALEILRKPGRIEVFPPDGAFYAFLGVGNYLNPGEDSIGLAERILESVKVAVVPATPFGAPKYIRISFATDEKTLKDGCERLVRFFEG